MGKKKYTGPERRSSYRRISKYNPENQLVGTRFGLTSGAATREGLTSTGVLVPQARTGAGTGIAQLRVVREHLERRQGPGRREGDLARALETGHEVTYDLEKMGKLKKIAKKAGKVGKAVVLGLSLYDMVNRNKQ